MNNFLPANIGTFVTLLMFVAIIPSGTFSGAIAAYLVQKIFFTLAGTFVYATCSSPCRARSTSISATLRRIPSRRMIVVGGGACSGVLARIFWRQLKKLWQQAKQGGAILVDPRRYMRAGLPAVLPRWMLQADRDRDLPRRLRNPGDVRIDHVGLGSGSLANVASFTPGAVGVTQATNALALETCCDVAESRPSRTRRRSS